MPIKKKVNNKEGRPLKLVDRDQVIECSKVGLTTSEIACIMKCSPDTLERRFHNELIRGREEFRASLRRKQFELAMLGNPTMLIWLGKNVLGQKDQVEHSGSVAVPLRREEMIAKLTAGRATPKP